jgi:hypothetical protein
MYQAFVKRLSSTLKSGNALTQQVRSSIEAQKKFVDKLVELTNYKVKQHLQIVKIQL